MNVERAQRLIDLPQIARASENAEQADGGVGFHHGGTLPDLAGQGEAARTPAEETMNVTFHALAALGIAHIAAIRLEPSRERGFCRSDAWVLQPQ
jgi:hypothetical protein